MGCIVDPPGDGSNNTVCPDITISSKFSTAKIHVKSDVAYLLKVYCLLKRKKMTEVASEILEERLHQFKDELGRMKEIQ